VLTNSAAPVAVTVYEGVVLNADDSVAFTVFCTVTLSAVSVLV